MMHSMNRDWCFQFPRSEGRQRCDRILDGWCRRIHPATRVHDGTDPVAAIEAVLAEPGVVQVHSRNVAYGCYMFRVTRAG